MDDNFIIVLFKNKLKRKIINKFKTFKRANEVYNNMISKSNEVIFEKIWENGNSCKYEIALLERKINGESIYSTDELGRHIKILLDDENYSIRQIKTYKKEEKIFDLNLNKKISINYFISKYLDNKTTKLVSSLNNKIIVQSDDNFNLFSLKNCEESHRLIDNLTKFFIDNNKGGMIFVKDTDPSQRSYLYNLLSEKGFDKKMLYRLTTTHSPR